MPNRQIIIVAAGGFAREAAWAAREAHEPFDVLGFLDDDRALHGTEICGAPVLGGVDEWAEHEDAEFLIAIGPPRARRDVARKMAARGTPRFATVIHRSVAKSDYVSIGEGSIVCAHSSLTTQISLGRHVIVNLNCTIGHDVDLGDFCTFAPLVACSGRVSFGAGVEIGTGVAIRQGLTIGDGALVGMGSVLTKDVGPATLWFGNPASEQRRLEAWEGNSVE